MKVQRVIFNTNYYDSGNVKYARGDHYPVTDQTKTCVLAGHADYIDVDMPKEAAQSEEADAKASLDAERLATIEAEEAALRGGDAV